MGTSDSATTEYAPDSGAPLRKELTAIKMKAADASVATATTLRAGRNAAFRTPI